MNAELDQCPAGNTTAASDGFFKQLHWTRNCGIRPGRPDAACHWGLSFKLSSGG
jgi:hypothetical protein